MRLYEYEGKILFKSMGINVPASAQAKNENDILQATTKIGYPCVIKAQVLRGGRGKAGLIKVVENDQQAMAAAQHIAAHLAENEIMLVEPKVNATSEAYVGITVDDIKGLPILVISRFGGVEVESISASGESGLAKFYLPADRCAERYQFTQVAQDAGFEGPMLVKIADIAWKLYETFLHYEAETAEINPVFLDEANKEVIAGDSKVIVDDYAFFRQPKLEEFRDTRDKRENDVKMIYMDLDGNVGVISLGASMTMMVIDTVKKLGGHPANFADIVSGASKENLKDLSLRVMQNSLDKPDSKAILVTFTLVAHPLRSAVEAVVEAYQEIKPKVPIIASIRAAGAALISMPMDEGITKLKENGITWYDRLDDAIDEVVRISKG